MFCDGYIFKSFSLSLHSLKSLVAVLWCGKVCLVLSTALLIFWGVTLVTVQTMDLKRCVIKVWWKYKYLMPVSRRSTPADGDWMEEKQSLCFHCSKDVSSVCMGLKGQSERGRQASISLVSKVPSSQCNFCFLFRWWSMDNTFCCFPICLHSGSFTITQMSATVLICPYDREKYRLFFCFWKQAGTWDSIYTSKLNSGDNTFLPWGKPALASHILPTKHSSSRTGMLPLCCPVGTGLPWFWCPEHPWELLGRVLTWPWTKVCQKLLTA